MKKSLKVLIASSAIMLGVSLLAGCEEKIPVSKIHEHTFSENWEASDSTHWHKATCEHTDVMSGVEDHKFGAWNTDKEPTQEAEGSKSRICTVCQYKQVAAIAKLDHTHVFAEAWSKDADYHWHDATCHSDVRTAVAEHTFGNWTVKVEPTETEKGLKERECSVCGYVEKAEVDKTLHVHTYASEWSTNETSHWKAATCEHADSFKDFGGHQFGEPVVVESTETVAGSKTYTCGVCGYVKVETLPLAEHVHTWDSGWSYDGATHWHAATCNCEDANADNLRKDVQDHEWGAWGITQQPTETVPGTRVRDCQICGYRYTEEIPVLAHTHVYSSQWSKNATEHWHAATCGHTDSRKDVANHTWGAWTIDSASNCTTQGTKHRTCSVCGYVENAPAELNTTAHSYASTWTYNESTHWHAATCGHAVKSGEASHTLNGAGTSYPTFTSARYCTVCGYVAQPAGRYTTETIPNGNVTIDKGSRRWFTFELLSPAIIKMNFRSDLPTNDRTVVAYIFNSNGGQIASSYCDNRYLTTNTTYAAGQYFLYVVNTRSADVDLIIYNYTHVYDKDEYDTFTATVGGVTSTYTMYYYDARYEVNDTYYTVENSSGDELLFMRNVSVSHPTNTKLGTLSYRDKNGASRTIYLPNYMYRSDLMDYSPYYVDEHNSDNLYICFNDVDEVFDFLYMDDYFKAKNGNLSELNANLFANMVYRIGNFYDYDFYYDADLGEIKSTNWSDYFGVTMEPNDTNLASHMLTTSANGSGDYYVAKSTGYDQFVFKVTNNYAIEHSYNKFTYYQNSRTYNLPEDHIILDSNFKEVAKDYRCSGGIRYKNNGTTINNLNMDYFAIEPGQTYYIVYRNYNATGFYANRAQYRILFEANNENVPENKKLINFDYWWYKSNSSTMAYYWQNSSYRSYYKSNWGLNDVGVNSEGQILVGYADNPNDSVKYTYTDKYLYETKAHKTLYGKWMDADNMIATGLTLSSTSVAGTSLLLTYQFGVADPNIVVKPGDAINLIYKNGDVKEELISGVAAQDVNGGSYYNKEQVTSENIYNTRLTLASGSSSIDVTGLVAIQLKTKFKVRFYEWFDDNEHYLDDVDKGDSFTAPAFEEMFDWDNLFNDVDGEINDTYFAGWSVCDRKGVELTTILDGATYTPDRDLFIEPLYENRANSKVVALRHDIGFETIGTTEYLKLKVLDPNLTITTATHFVLVFSDGSTAEIGVTQLLTINGVNLPDGAKTTDGEILLNVFNLETKKADIQRAVQIRAA